MQWSLLVLIVMGQCSSIGGQLCGYHFIRYEKSWKEAQEYCRKHHTDLATVSNQTDMQRLLDSTTEQYKAGAWIGLQRDWRWSQPGVKFNESEWSPGQPDNKDNPVHDPEYCVRMNVGKWDDDSCSTKYKCICYDEHNKTGKTFHIIDTVMNWTEAQSYCRDNHTDLISGVKQLEDFKRQHQNYATCPSNGNSCPDPVWIGLFRDSDWSWSDGNNFSFRSWDNAEPKDKQDPKKLCAMTTSNRNWSSADCNETKPFFCYDDSVILIKENMTWVDALYYCRDHYRDLVSITNQDEQLWVQERAKMASTPYVWLGLRYTCTLDLWFWVTDETVLYKNWGPDQSGEDCNMSGAMDREGMHQWVKMIDDESEFNFICSK